MKIEGLSKILTNLKELPLAQGDWERMKKEV